MKLKIDSFLIACHFGNEEDDLRLAQNGAVPFRRA